MKKLIFAITLIAMALLSTFPVKDMSAAVPQSCSEPVQSSDGTWKKVCGDSNSITIYKADCPYCPWKPVVTQSW